MSHVVNGVGHPKEQSGSRLGSDEVVSSFEDNNPFAPIAGSESQEAITGTSSAIDGEIDDSVQLFSKSSDRYNEISINFESRVSKLLKPEYNVAIQIIDASNSNEGSINSSKKYIVYTIKLFDLDQKSMEIITRRRYSDFESLHDILTKLFPLVIIPPIPRKNYFNLKSLNGLVSDSQLQASQNQNNNQAVYSYINSTHLTKSKLIEHRKRLLSNFLNSCLQIPQVRNLDFFAKFLDPNANWSDEISLISSQLPKSIYNSNPENGLKTDPIYSNLPSPLSNNTISFLKDNKKKLTKKTNKLVNGSTDSADSKKSDNAKNDYILDTSSLDYLNKKIMENFIGLSNDYTDLGTIFNTFSLTLSEIEGKSKSDDDIKLGIIFDKVGQIFDRSYLTINSLVSDLETKFSEPLGEAVQYTSTLHDISKYQDRKQKQKQLLDSEVQEKKAELAELLVAEDESARIEGAVNSQDRPRNSDFSLPTGNNDGTSTEKPVSSGKFKLFSIKKITQYVTEIIDQNPQETRKQRISVLQEKIAILEKCQTIMLEDLSYITDEIGKNFKVFREKQLKQIYEILFAYNGFLIGWAKKNVDIWEEIRDEIQKL